MQGSIEWKIDVADTGRINLRLDSFPKAVQRQLKQTIGQLTQRLLVSVEAAQPVRTGALRRATHAFVDEGLRNGAPWVRGRVRVSRESGLGARFGALEYGGSWCGRIAARARGLARTQGGSRASERCGSCATRRERSAPLQSSRWKRR
jgi:hypothetical protein